MRVSILIPTFRRPDWLGDALESCLRQTGFGPADYEIVVVDNCLDRSAAATVAAAGAGAAVPVRYVHEPRPGVSHARNSGVAACRAPLIAFLDDDEIAVEGWLAALLDAQGRFDADVVWGPVRGRPENPRRGNAEFVAAFYSRDLDRPTGPMDDFCGAGNALLRRATCLYGPEPFDLRVGFTGGEDDLLFTALKQQGRRFVWCREAVVFERVPDSRARYAHIWWRSFRRGQGPSMICAMSRPPDRLGLLRWMAIGAGQALVYGPAALALWAVGSRRAPAMTALAIAGAGKLLWMPPFQRAYYGAPRQPVSGD